MIYTFVVLGLVFGAASAATLMQLKTARAILWTLFVLLVVVSLAFRWELPR